MASEFARHLIKIHDDTADAAMHEMSPMVAKREKVVFAVDNELAEVRAVLSMTADRRYPQHGHCWCRKDLTDDNEPHDESCQRARALYERLVVR